MRVVFSMVCTHLRLSGILFCMVISGFLMGAPAAAQETYVHFANRLVNGPPAETRFSASIESAILVAANAYRRSQGYAPLKAGSAKMAFAARAQAVDLLLQGRVGHVSAHGNDFVSRMRALRPGMMNLPTMGENAARSTRHGLSDAEISVYIMQQWIRSPAHRHALLSREYLTVATGVARRGDSVYAVQIFVGPEVKSNIGLPR
jgi:uncharacterized protein YkwD